ncbi:hypothetical protein EG68_08300 [Paragonimus skrjabini miyazakii]|uniref:Uncharacterized protein n=1 Tax=Paragonimus skrjabini miyazakii TaxID=59628 RepID=A0A8S9YQ57_9TREM|nr:hypothetical protein EG68_08300 [Paragonimus skrjabini miyazakii]
MCVHILFVCSLSLLILTSFSEAIVLNTSSVRDEIVETLFANYQSHVRPNQNETLVTVYMSISAITSVDVRNMEYKTEMLLRQAWQDPRLAWDRIPKFAHYNRNIVSPVFKSKIWLPDLFFRNGKQGRLHTMTRENLLIRIQPNGEILYSQKITMRLACQMELRTFPMDTQECGMDIGSYGYTLNQLRFVWRNESPVSLKPNIQISEFDPPENVVTHDCSSLYSTSTGQYTCLNATFTLSRQITYWLASTYLPNILIMIVSWLNFWVSLEATPARVNLSLLTLLGVITQSTSFSSILPRVSYIKAIDVWSIACISFNSGVLLEFAIASHLSRRRKVSAWQVEVRKMVRQELARWCTACQQQYNQLGPSASSAYQFAGCQASDKTAQYMSSATTAALAMQNAPISGSPTQMSVRLTRSGQLSLVSNKQSPQPEKKRSQPDPHDTTTVDLGPLSPEATQTEALLPVTEKPKPKPNPVDPIDLHSRVLFPSCFIIYNCFYWLYYLVLVKRHKYAT